MNISSIAGSEKMSAPHMVSGASTYSSPTATMGNLFQNIDTSNTGSITSGQFQQGFATLNPPANFQSLGANAIFSQLDPNGTGSVSKADFVSGMTALKRSFSSAGASGTTAPAAAPVTSTPAQSLSQSLQSFLQLGSQASSLNDGVGNILDMQL